MTKMYGGSEFVAHHLYERLPPSREHVGLEFDAVP